MNNRRGIYGAVIGAKLLFLFYLIQMLMIASSAAGGTGKPMVFTHAVFAELGTATW